MEITEFLTARYNERMAALRRLEDGHCEGFEMSVPGGPVAFSTRTEMADIMAKRALIADLATFGRIATEKASGDLPTSLTARGVERGIMHSLRTLAVPFASHKDYDPTWRP